MLFIDTGPLLARYVERDQHHEEAKHGWAELRTRREHPVTSNFVLDELFTLLGRRAGHDFAAERARQIYASSGALQILRPDREDELRAVDLFTKYADQRVSFTDCTSFALMKRGRIRQAFTFDAHFRSAGFDVWSPAEALR